MLGRTAGDPPQTVTRRLPTDRVRHSHFGTCLLVIENYPSDALLVRFDRTGVARTPAPVCWPARRHLPFVARPPAGYSPQGRITSGVLFAARRRRQATDHQ